MPNSRPWRIRCPRNHNFRAVSRDDIITLLVENGKWDIDDMKDEDKKRVKSPKLPGYTVWDGKGVAYLETDVLKLAKHLPEKAPGGIEKVVLMSATCYFIKAKLSPRASTGLWGTSCHDFLGLIYL